MNLLNNQLQLLNFPSEIAQHSNEFSTNELNVFTEKYVSHLISTFGLEKVQSSIDRDSNPNDPIINYITCLLELGMLNEFFHQFLRPTIFHNNKNQRYKIFSLLRFQHVE
mgnify:CR=1 FL=1